jgi:hypothetical protein
LLGYTSVVGLLRRRAVRIDDASRPAPASRRSGHTPAAGSSGVRGCLSPMPNARGSNDNSPQMSGGVARRGGIRHRRVLGRPLGDAHGAGHELHRDRSPHHGGCRCGAGLYVLGGLALNKVVAKIASKWAKPSGFTAIQARDIHLYIKDLPAQKVYGIGAQRRRSLRSSAYAPRSTLRAKTRTGSSRTLLNLMCTYGRSSTADLPSTWNWSRRPPTPRFRK